jgi:hypothetical protein
VIKYIQTCTNPEIKFLKHAEIIHWLFADTSFLCDKTNKKILKGKEDNWGRQILKLHRPDLKPKCQWTNRFGEHISEEIAILSGKKPKKPRKINNMQPDIELDSAIWEIKTQTYFTPGTAGEKILGCPFKYADVPLLYGKPLYIVCVGGAEKQCREVYENLNGSRCTLQKQKFLNFFKHSNIHFIAASDMLVNILRNSK